MSYEHPKTIDALQSKLLNSLRVHYDQNAVDLLRKGSTESTKSKFLAPRKVRPNLTESRIEQQAKELHRLLPGEFVQTILTTPDPLQALLEQINANGDAWPVYKKLTPADREKVLLTLDINNDGKAKHKLSSK